MLASDLHASGLKQHVDQLQVELNDLRQQRSYDNEQRSKLHRTQLINQEEKIQAMEGRLKKVLSEKEQLQMELDRKKSETPGHQILKQMTEQINQLEEKLKEKEEEKKKMEEKLTEMEKIVRKYEKEGAEILLRDKLDGRLLDYERLRLHAEELAKKMADHERCAFARNGRGVGGGERGG